MFSLLLGCLCFFGPFTGERWDIYAYTYAKCKTVKVCETLKTVQKGVLTGVSLPPTCLPSHPFSAWSDFSFSWKWVGWGGCRALACTQFLLSVALEVTPNQSIELFRIPSTATLCVPTLMQGHLGTFQYFGIINSTALTTLWTFRWIFTRDC